MRNVGRRGVVAIRLLDVGIFLSIWLFSLERRELRVSISVQVRQ